MQSRGVGAILTEMFGQVSTPYTKDFSKNSLFFALP
jgi:hypothetical protein